MCLHIQNDCLGQPDTEDEDRSAFMDDYATYCASMVPLPQQNSGWNIQLSCWKMFVIYLYFLLHTVRS